MRFSMCAGVVQCSRIRAHAKNVQVIDRMPENYVYVGWLAVLFPNAKFIYCFSGARSFRARAFRQDPRITRTRFARISAISR